MDFLRSSGLALTAAACNPVFAAVADAGQIGIGIIGTGVRGKQLIPASSNYVSRHELRAYF